MRRKNKLVRKIYALLALGMAAAISGTVYAGSESGRVPAGKAGGAAGGNWTESMEFIVNQGLGMGIDETDGSYYPIDCLVAERMTGFFVRMTPETMQEEGGPSALLISNGTGTWRFEDGEYLEEYELFCFDTSGQSAWDGGQYHVRVEFPDGGSLEKEIAFRDMKDIEILIVPIDGYYSGEKKQAGKFDESLCDYTAKVYPVGENDLKWDIRSGEEMAVGSLKYDLDTSIGRLRVWQYLKKLGGQNGSDMVIGIVAKNMKSEPSAKEATVTGFTFGDYASVISLEDVCPSVTIAHEIGHCLSLGDEYENGTFSVSMNMVPYKMKGKNRFSLSEIVEGSNPYIRGGAADEKQGTGTIVYAQQYPYDILGGDLIAHDMTSFMGLSGYPESEYWVTAQIWESLYQELAEEGEE